MTLEQPPSAEPRPQVTTHFGRERRDDFDWFRAKKDPEVLAYLEAENAWTEQQTAHLAELRDQIFGEIKTRTRETDLSVPQRVRGHWYYGRSFEGREYGASCRVPVTDPGKWLPPRPDEDASPDRPALSGEQVLLDLDQLADGHDFFSLGGSSISPDENLLAYGTDVIGDERYTIRIKDLRTGELLPDEITGTRGGGVWDRAGENLYYGTYDESWRADKVWRHGLGTDQSEDELVYHEPDVEYWVGIGRSRDDRFLVIGAGSRTTSEYRVLDADAGPDATFEVFSPREEGLEYDLEPAVIGGEPTFLVTHNGSGPDFEISTSPITPTTRSGWTPLIPHQAGTRIEGVSAYDGHLVVDQRSDGQTQLRILTLDDDGIADDRLMEFDDQVRTVGSAGNPEWEQPVVRFAYTSLAKPPSVWSYDVATGEQTLLKKSEVLPTERGAYDPAAYDEHRLWATAADGTQIPISLVVPTGTRPGDRLPILLYAYGAYEVSWDPRFSIANVSLLDRGVGYAIAHVRGGGEMGRHWYDDGKLAAKQNTFSDFADCARYLIEEGWTRPDALVAEGGSAGGLLIGAVANQAPELFAGMVASVPFVDNLTTMLDASLPLTTNEYSEWGNPEASAEEYDRLAAYAPYDNVGEQTYPAILAESSLHDTRVLYVEATKWVARLRHLDPSGAGRPDILLKTEMSAGHGGVSGRYRAWQDRAYSLAWMLDRMGLA